LPSLQGYIIFITTFSNLSEVISRIIICYSCCDRKFMLATTAIGRDSRIVFKVLYVNNVIEIALNTENTTVEQMTMDVINVRFS
jgi:hypothetical protein